MKIRIKKSGEKNQIPFGVKTRPSVKEKSSGGKNILRFQKNPFTKEMLLKEKDVEYKTKETPRQVYKSTTISSPSGEDIKEIKKIKRAGKLIGSEVIDKKKEQEKVPIINMDWGYKKQQK